MIQVEASAHAEAYAGSGSPLTVFAQPGQLLVLITSSQWGHIGVHGIPKGWAYSYSDGTGSANRSGFIAWTWAAHAGDVTVSQWWHSGTDYTARQRALMLVLSGVEPGSSPAIIDWTARAPATPTPGLLIAQEHASAGVPLNAFTVDDAQVVHAGESSTTASWSSLRVLLTSPSGGGITETQTKATTVWAAIGLQPESRPTTTVRLSVLGAEERVISSTQSALTEPESVDVDGLLARKGGWMIAHRGGSADWPEMSLRAYSESVSRNVPALEFSLNLTADGVPVGVHDRNLQGVDASAPNTDVAKMTWAEVRRYTTRGEPFIRLEDLQAAYGDDHVLLVDPKHSAVEYQTYLPWLNPDHTILKYFGNALWLAKIWRKAGFRTWGYVYEEHITSGQAATWAPHWDLLGVPWHATESAWETARGYGVPIIGHICNGQQALDTCFSRGAIGAMCAKVDGMVLS
ncbi:glycerophosphodiester phosphodiesterase family protein [Actinomyces sp.]|uniref:glycerophosphodiester phosphodiesterase n=1 Tax=Actinomyces sp. TaxID=29317 RepID=UPI0026DCF6E3|nr:glycerophosphodiester phosphodiesterase family protein [Actinomyces sp.]MDO4901452.1 glycerophosphodiester phosphodiesterase family protein [Actinomyces sp.]